LRLEAPLHRIVADDWLVSVDTNRYSVPFTLVGEPVEIHRAPVFSTSGTRAHSSPSIPS